MMNVPRFALRFLVLGAFLFLASSCKSKKIISDGTLDANISAKNLIKTHYQNQLDFKTITGKIKIEYSDGDDAQSVGVSLRMKKDEAIWMSAPLGIVKAYITPDRVSFYNKLENTYFDGDFTYLTQLLGTELDFKKVQNLLLGEALFDLRKAKYSVTSTGETYLLKPKVPIELFKILFEIEPKNFKMASQQLSQPSQKRLLNINYKNYQKINKWILPNEVYILATEGTNRNTINLEYRNMQFDEPVNFPYKIPNGYDEIVLSKNDI
ncbi:DUF4292 domain-containing protein [Maribacter halichondriae]|uniref:DUF4292 domain-containing protein n=1 Tax=Maribacter halichondriae TaxID=2980554 RepID=UPI0030760E36